MAENTQLPTPARAPRTTAERKRPAERERVGFGAARPKLEVAVDELRESGYHVHWFNDTDARISEAEAAFYEFVTWKEIGGVRGKDGAGKPDERVSKRVGTNDDGTALIAYLMKIPVEYYQEDEAAKQEQDAEKVRAMQQGLDDKNTTGEGRYGANISIKRSAHL